MRKYYYSDGISKFGPVTKEELKSQKLTRNTLIWHPDLEEWTPIDQIKDLNDIILSIPPDIKTISIQTNHREEKSAYLKFVKPVFSKIDSKWLIIMSLGFILITSIFILNKNQSNESLHKMIVNNSFEGNENFNFYVEKFYRDLNYHGIRPKKPDKIIIKFSKLDQLDNTTHIHGISYGIDNDSLIEIYINPSSWQKFNKAMRYLLMYHELSHDVLNINDLEEKPANEGKLMYPRLSNLKAKNMDEFIESFHSLFEEQSTKH